MTGKENFRIPLLPPRTPSPERDYPITLKENFMRASRHEKPLWMPMHYQSSQWPLCMVFNDIPPYFDRDCVDWFGVKYKYEAAQSGVTPVPDLFEEISEWREKVNFPDLDKVDWKGAAADFVRNENLALGTRLGNGCFERLFMSEGFEQALCDILLEQEECKAFFDRLTDYKVDVIKHYNGAYHFDFMCHNDDWANAKSQFFSNEVFEHTLLDSAVRIADAVRAEGSIYMLHCCGMMENFLPYIVNDIRADLIEIQPINDFRMILDRYGDRVTPLFNPDPYILYNPETRPEEAREYARYIVDTYGAHTCDGAGIIVKPIGTPELFSAFEDEIYHYSLEKYKNL